MLAGVLGWSVGPRGHSSGSKKGAGRRDTVGWEASEGSHRGMFQLTGHVLLHCSLACIIHMYAHKACWEQTSDMQCLENLLDRKEWKANMVSGDQKAKSCMGELSSMFVSL